MFQRSIYVGFLLAAIACQASSHPRRRAARSPDSSMQVNVPDNSADYQYDPDNQYNQEAKDEAQYWEEQEKTMEEEGSDGNGGQLEEEREYQEDQDQQYRDEGNATMTQSQDSGEQHQDAAEDHYTSQHQDFDSDSDQVDRYENKGETGMNNTQDKMENYDAEGKSPSISYNSQ